MSDGVARVGISDKFHLSLVAGTLNVFEARLCDSFWQILDFRLSVRTVRRASPSDLFSQQSLRINLRH